MSGYIIIAAIWGFSNFMGFDFGPQSSSVALVAEDPPYYLLLENDDRLLAENNDLIEKEHL